MANVNYEMTAIFTRDGFLLDTAPASGRDYYFDQALLDDFAGDKYKAMYDLGFAAKKDKLPPTLAYLQYISREFSEALSRDSDIEITRKPSKLTDEKKFAILRAMPYGVGIEFIDERWVEAIWNNLGDVFAKEIKSCAGAVGDYLKSKNSEINVVGRVFFHLVESKRDDAPFAFLSTYSTGSEEKVNHLPLKNALMEYKEDQDKLLALLATVSRAVDKSALISELVESGELFSPLKFGTGEAYTFLKEVPIYEECGIICRIPDWWRRKGRVCVSVSIGNTAPSMVGMEALLSFDPEIYLSGLKMSKEEIESLLLETGGLSLIKGKWVEVDHDKLKAALEAFDKAASTGHVTFAEAMRMQLDADGGKSDDEAAPIEITNGEWLNAVRGRLTDPVKIGGISPGDNFRAVLRRYQQIGLNWLGQMKSLGFGSLLADDMGLGKTVQILALLEYIRLHNGAKTLLVIPASLLCNWRNEADKFAPKLKYSIIHTGSKEFDIDDADLFITTYGMAARLDALKDTEWDMIVLDEAQAIKNSGTKQTKAIKSLKSSHKIAMTGTPIENRLSDLWSIFDFLNKGLLGSSKEFDNFTKGLKDDIRGYSRLRDIVNPFILRRLKTDKAVISDLPDKVEVKAFTELTKKQAVLYGALVKDIEKALAGFADTSGIARKGLVLASIMKFKQICNHPDQYLGQSSFDASHSGKFEKLAEICETVAQKRERALVFTQFKEMTQPIADYLETVFRRKGLVLHGGTPVKKRGELVERFNGEEYTPFMVLSLKAGGTGLNLTSANHVIHFDRWWNPAVENQATDRAFRIGQKKNVIVHKFITLGTIEEKIDAMLEEKQKMAGDVIASGAETWITEMDDAELLNLFKLEA
ncbi:MAG: DEAD/DEAH box helicase [Synergistaceae bacterium]|jgi:non-specific serine/threonine protein kinase|nr:DEAD/DEAH box helicase [Synergistaceae bacterium]